MNFSKQADEITSVKVRQSPGGQSNFSLAWGEPAPVNKYKAPVTNSVPLAPLKESNQPPTAGKVPQAHTSVKVRNPSGGRSNIVFG